MQINDAFNILNLTGYVDIDIIKIAYRKACKLYHPDRNPSGLHMMKLVNLAYDAVKGFTGDVGDDSKTGYASILSDALNAINGLDLEIEICGAWVWVSGDSKPYKDILKTAGFKYAIKKQQWFYRPDDYKSRSRGGWDMDKIRNKYGSKAVKDTRAKLRKH